MPTSETWVKKAIGSLSPGFFSSKPSPIIIPHSPHAWGNRVLGWMGRTLGDQTVRNVTVDMRKKKIASEATDKKTDSNSMAPAATTIPMEKTPTMDTSEANGHATSSTGTVIGDSPDPSKS
jgi:hypothetical protein